MTRLIDPQRIEVVDDAMLDVWRTKSRLEKATLVFDANEAYRRRLAGFLLTKHPDWSAAQIEAAVARRMLRAAR
jgi:hypothetical protein